ncbi:MAG: NAD(P)H-dependent oxidoreductase [Acidobacteriota bacterium]
MLKLHVIIVSTRPGRAGVPVANWFFERAKRRGNFDVTLLDLQQVALPMFDEPRHPRFGQYEHDHTKAWSALIAPADAFVFVTPEYNYSAPPSLTNALDFLSAEWAHKPVGFVSYGGVSGGTRAVQMAKQTVTALKMMPLSEAVAVPFFQQSIENGVFTNELQDKPADALLDELHRWAEALKTLRSRA